MTEPQYKPESSNKYSPCLSMSIDDHFTKPTTKLEQIESLILIPSSSNAAFINNNNNNLITNDNNNNKKLSSSNNINTIFSNTSSNNIFDSDNKIVSLKRSISDKLRNSFKSNSNKINNCNSSNTTFVNNNSNNENANKISDLPYPYPILTLTRKWHSERYKNRKIQLNINNNDNNVNNNRNKNRSSSINNTNKLSFKLSSQINPLNSHCKTILAQCTNKNKLICNHNHKNIITNFKPANSFETQSKNKSLFNFAKSSNKSHTKNKPTTKKNEKDDCQTKSSNATSYSSNKPNKNKKIILNKTDSKNNFYFEHHDFGMNKKFNIKNEYFSNDSIDFMNHKENDDSTTDDEEFNIQLKKTQRITSTTDSSDDSDQDDDDYLYNENQKSNKLIRSHSFSIGDKNNFVPLEISNNLSMIKNVDRPISSKTSDQLEFYQDLIINSSVRNRDDFYERVTSQKHECQICFERVYLNERLCCKFKACNNCINSYIQTKIKNSCGLVKIECLNTNCIKLIHREEICERMSHYDNNMLKNYLKYLVEANKDSNCKTCPRCSHIMRLDDYKSKNANAAEISVKLKTRSSSFSGISSKKKFKKLKDSTILTKVQCIECQLIWCFQCHAPWHDGITCKEFRRGDRMLKYWAKEVHFGQQNAQVCPKCKIYIQRTKGCDHMVCTYCQTEFCYKCGGKFRRLKFIGDHYSKLSVLGCKYRLYPEKPAKRKLIRSSILGVKVLAAPLVATIGMVVGIGALAVGCIALPIYGSYKLVNHFRTHHLNRSNNGKKSSIKLMKVSEIVDNSFSTSFEDNAPLYRHKLDNAINSNIVNEAALNLIPREASQNQKLISMINKDIDKLRSKSSVSLEINTNIDD